MREFQQKKRVKKIKNSKAVLIFAAAFSVLLLSSSYDLFLKKKQVQKRVNEANKELQNIRKKQTDVNTDIDTISNPHGQERLIREKYNVKKEGEQVIVVMNKENSKDEIKATKTDILYEIKHFFTNLF